MVRIAPFEVEQVGIHHNPSFWQEMANQWISGWTSMRLQRES